MYRIDNGTAAGAIPAYQPVGPNPNGYFSNGNPAVPTPATVVDGDWLNSVQEEICAPILAAGIALQKGSGHNGQLAQAIQSNVMTYAVDTSVVADAIKLQFTPALPAAPSDGFTFRFKLANTITGAPTIALYTGMAPVTLFNNDGQRLSANALIAGRVYEAVYTGGSCYMTAMQMPTGSAWSQAYGGAFNIILPSVADTPGDAAGIYELCLFTALNNGGNYGTTAEVWHIHALDGFPTGAYNCIGVRVTTSTIVQTGAGPTIALAFGINNTITVTINGVGVKTYGYRWKKIGEATAY